MWVAMRLFVAICLASLCESSDVEVVLRSIKLETWGGAISGPQDPVVRVGAVSTLNTQSGVLVQWAYATFLEWLNYDRGGISLGGTRHKVEMTIIGDFGAPLLVEQATIHLVSQGIRLTLGPQSDQLSVPWANVVQQAGALGISPAASSEVIFANKPLVFGIIPSLATIFRDVLQAYQGNPQATTVGFVRQEDANGGFFYSEMCNSVVTLAPSYGFTVVSQQVLPTEPTSADINAAITRLATEDPDILFGCTTEAVCEAFIHMSKLGGWSPRLQVNHACVTNPSFTSNMGDDALWFVGVESWVLGSSSPESIWEWAGLTGRFEDRYGQEPSLSVYQAWAALATLMSSLERSGSQDPTAVAASLREGPVGTLYGRVAFDANGQNNATGWRQAQYQSRRNDKVIVDPSSDVPAQLYFPMPTWDQRNCHLKPEGPIYGYDQNGVCGECNLNEAAVYNASTQKRLCSTCPGGAVWVMDEAERLCLSQCRDGAVPLMNGGCQVCHPGTYQNGPYCEPCPPGRMAPNRSMSTCALCPEGKFTEAFGAASCQDCAPGKALNYQGGTKCEKCSPGRSANSSGNSGCTLCSTGRVATDFGTSTCEPCPEGYRSDWGSQGCIACPPGQFQEHKGKSACEMEPFGARASDYATVHPANDPGHWVKWTYNDQGVFEPPGSYEKCKYYPEACLTGEQCAEGHMGRQCLACAPGYAKLSASRGCVKCPNWWQNLFFTVVLFSIQIGVILFIARMIVEAKLADLHAILVKLLFNHVIAMGATGTILRGVISQINADQDAHDIEVGKFMSFLFQFLEVFAGTIPQLEFWSFPCLVMPNFDDIDTAAAYANHSYYLHPDLAESRAALRDLAMWTDINTLVFLLLMQGVILGVCYLIGFVTLHRHLRKNKYNYRDALRYYRDVFNHSFSEVRSRPASRWEWKWESYVEAFHLRLYGFWKPVSHMYTFQKQGYCDLWLFLQESDPIFLVAMFIIFAPALRGAVKGSRCVYLTNELSVDALLDFSTPNVLLHNSEINCSIESTILPMAIFVFSLIGVCLPVFLLIRHWSARSSRGTDIAAQRQWNLVSNGYTSDCWWWETVIFFRKTLLYILQAIPVGEDVRSLLYLILALLACTLQLHFSPYDGRCNRLLTKLEWGQLAIWVASAVVITACNQTAYLKMVAVYPTILMAANLIYMSFLIYYILKYALIHYAAYLSDREEMTRATQENVVETAIPQLKKVSKRVRLWTRIKKQILMWKQNTAISEPYVSMDPGYAWLSVVGSRGDMAVPIPMKKGHEVKDAPGQIPLLSQADWPNDAHVAVAETPSSARMEVQKSIATAVKRILMNGQGVFSISLLDFVIRACFVLHYEARAREDAGVEGPEEVEEVIVKGANLKGDPIMLVADVVGRLDHTDPRSLEIEAMAFKMEEELRKTEAAVLKKPVAKKSGWLPRFVSVRLEEAFENTGFATAFQPITDIASKRLQEAQRHAGTALRSAANLGGAAALQAKAAAIGAVLAGGEEEEPNSAEQRRADAEDKAEEQQQEHRAHDDSSSSSDSDMERKGIESRKERNKRQLLQTWNDKYKAKVDKMLSGKVFRKGLRMEDFQFAIIMLQEIPAEELTVWLDGFERKWVHDRATISTRLRLLALSTNTKKTLWHWRNTSDFDVVCEEETDEAGREQAQDDPVELTTTAAGEDHEALCIEDLMPFAATESSTLRAAAVQSPVARRRFTERGTSLDFGKDVLEVLEEKGELAGTEWEPLVDHLGQINDGTHANLNEYDMAWVRFVFLCIGGPQLVTVSMLNRTVRKMSPAHGVLVEEIREVQRRREDLAAKRQELEAQIAQVKRAAASPETPSSTWRSSTNVQVASSAAHPLATLRNGLEKEAAASAVAAQKAKENQYGGEQKVRYNIFGW